MTVESDTAPIEGAAYGSAAKKRITPYIDLTITPVRKSRMLPRGGRICIVKDAMIALGTAIEAKGATMMLARGAMRGSRSKWYKMRGVVPRLAKVETTTTSRNQRSSRVTVPGA